MKWSDITTFTFVEEYLKHECLFHIKSINYRDKSAKDAALVEICEKMNLEDFGLTEAKAKIKSIRSTYSQELKKINESKKSGDDNIYVPKLKWFAIYHKFMKEKNLISKENQSILNNTETETEWLDSDGDDSSSQEIPIFVTTQDDPIKQEPESIEKVTIARKRKFQYRDNVENRGRAVRENVQNQNHTNSAPSNNEFDVFGESIAAQLKAMPLLLALQSQAHIQSYLTSLRMQSIMNPDYCPSPPPLHLSATSYDTKSPHNRSYVDST